MFPSNRLHGTKFSSTFLWHLNTPYTLSQECISRRPSQWPIVRMEIKLSTSCWGATHSILSSMGELIWIQKIEKQINWFNFIHPYKQGIPISGRNMKLEMYLYPQIRKKLGKKFFKTTFHTIKMSCQQWTQLLYLLGGCSKRH